MSVLTSSKDLHFFGGSFGGFAARGALKASSGGPAIPFTAATLPGCVLALRGDLGVEVSGTAVQEWKDQSGNGYHAIPSTEPSTPTQTTGQPFLSFDGTQSFEVHALAPEFDGEDQPLSIFALVRRSTQNVRGVFGAWNNTNGQRLRLEVQTSGRFRVDKYDGTTPAAAISSFDVANSGEWCVIGFTVPGGVTNLYDAERLDVQNDSFDTGNVSFTYARVGAFATTNGNASSGFEGDIAALCMYTTDLTGDNARAVADNLIEWAIYEGLYLGESAPDQIPDLYADWDADITESFDLSSNFDWADQVSGIVLRQGLGVNKPTLSIAEEDSGHFNGGRVVLFGDSHYLQATNAPGEWSFLHDGSGGTLVVVYEALESSAGNVDLVRTGNGPGVDFRGNGILELQRWRVYNDGGPIAFTQTANGAAPQGQVRFDIGRYATGGSPDDAVLDSGAVRVQASETGSPSVSDPPHSLRLGYTSAGGRYRIKRVLAFQRFLTDLELSALNRHLSRRYIPGYATIADYRPHSWYRAEAGLAFGTNISAVESQGWAKLDMTQASGTLQPPWLSSSPFFGGRPAFDPDGAGDYLVASSAADWDFTLGPGATIAANAKSNLSGGMLWATTPEGANGVWLEHDGPNERWELRASASSVAQTLVQLINNSQAVLGDAVVARWQDSPSDVDASIDFAGNTTTLVDWTPTLTGTPDVPLTLFKRGTTSVFWGGQASDIAVFDRVLSNTETAALQTAMQSSVTAGAITDLSDLPGLVSWYRGDNADSSGSVGGNFRWTDLSGNGHHLDADAGGTDPDVTNVAAANGQMGVRFDSASESLTCVSAASAFDFLHTAGTEGTVFLVWVPDGSTALNQILLATSSASGPGVWYEFDSANGHDSFKVRTAAGASLYSSDSPNGEVPVSAELRVSVIRKRDGRHVEVDRFVVAPDGFFQDASSSGLTFDSGNAQFSLTLGSLSPGSSSSPFLGHILELGLFEVRHHDRDVSRALQYLRGRYVG